MDNKNLLNLDDLADVFAQLESIPDDNEAEQSNQLDEEISASQRRYNEIIKKHKEEQ